MNAAERTPHAWVDESVHVGAGFYVLAATVCLPSDCDRHRSVLRQWVRSPRHRLHWRDEEHRDRLRIARSLAGLGLDHVVAIGSPLDPKRQERARRKCLERLLTHLHADGIATVWMETRGVVQDRRDLAMVASMRSSGMLTASLHVMFARPLDEPMLWIPDAVAGAIAAAVKGVPAYRDPIKAQVTKLDTLL